MTDNLSPADRLKAMRAVRSKDTKPELLVRRTAHALGYRFRLCRKDLPGTPDLVFPRHSKVIFVHGCFWHRHGCRAGRSTPTSNPKMWKAKFDRTIERDRRALRELRRLGWEPLVVWECQARSEEKLRARLKAFLER